MVKRPRGDIGIAAEDVAKLLGRAGWEWRRAQGDHLVITKPGFDRITLSERLSMLQFKNVERVLGMQLETLLTKQYKRGRGMYLPEDEVRKRLGLAHTMWRSGFPAGFISKHCGISGGIFADFRIKMFENLSFEEVVRHFMRKRGGPSVGILQVVKEEVPEVVSAVEQPEVELPPQGEAEAAPDEAVPDDHDALLDLVQGALMDMRQLVAGRKKRSEVAAAALAGVVHLRYLLEAELQALQDKVEELLAE